MTISNYIFVEYVFFNQEFKITQAMKMVKNKGVGENNQIFR